MKTESAEDILRRLWKNRDVAFNREAFVQEEATIRRTLAISPFEDGVFYKPMGEINGLMVAHNPSISKKALGFKADAGTTLDELQIHCIWYDLTDWLFGPPYNPDDSPLPSIANTLQSLNTFDARLLLPFLAQHLRPKEKPI